jgi:hypothetical protein
MSVVFRVLPGLGPLGILEKRPTDAKAQEFVKKRRGIEAKVAT